MARILRMPGVAANATEAVLEGWPIAENARFSAMDAIATVETEKAVVDIEAEADGILLKTLVSPGTVVEVGAPIAVIGDPGEKVDDLDALLASLGILEAPAANRVPESIATDLPSEPAAPPVTSGTGAHPNGEASHARIFASPLARRLAKQANLAIEQIVGTGPGGRIRRRDIEAAVAKAPREGSPVTTAEPQREDRPAAAAVAQPADRSPAQPAVAPARPYTDLPHTRLRKAVATRLTQSKQETPHFYLRGTCRVDALLDLREELNFASPVKISLNDMVIKAAVRAHTLVPEMNVIWTPDAVRSFTAVDVGVAIATERGLITPVVRSADEMSISQIAARVQDYVARAKVGRIQQAELEGGTFCVTNLGMFGTEDFDAIINPPQSAILAVGAARQEPIAVDGQLTVGTVMRVTLSVDHRPIDGVLAAKWMQTFISIIERPIQLLV